MEKEIIEYAEYLFAVAMKKCGNISDAEDLTQDVLLAALQYMDRGGTITNLKYWLTSVLSNKWNDLLRKKYHLPLVSFDMIPDIEDVDDTTERPCAEDVRREVAYLSKLQREVIAKHYLEGKSVQNIADDLGIPKGTVLSRLSSGREQMRKGLNDMEQYEKHSYQPERLEISCHGCRGFHDEPWSLVANDMMKQNILIVAYNKPISVVEIAHALGIPTAYIENAVFELTKSELMRQIGSKYYTDFMIVSPEQILKRLDVELAFAEEHYVEMLRIVREYQKAISEVDFIDQLTDAKKKKLEYYFILHLFSHAIYTAIQKIVPSTETYPVRPDGGKWIAEGAKYPQDFDFENYLFGKYCYGGERRIYWENFLSAKSIDLKIYDTQPDLNKYNRGTHGIRDDDLAKLLYIISREIPIETTGVDVMLCESIPHLIECGILGEHNGTPFVNVPIITPDEYNELDKIRIGFMHCMADMLEPWLREIFPKLRIDIPKHLEGHIAEFRQYSCYAIPMAFMKKAIVQGDFDAKDATPPMVFVVDDCNRNLR